MNNLDHAALTGRLVPAALAAGEAILRHRAQGVRAEQKSDRSPVTAADREAEDLVLAALGDVAPGVPVVAEEAMAAGREPTVGDQFFLVDALDGTREFLSGSADFTVNVALVEGGVPCWGLVYAPAVGRLFVTTGPGKACEAVVGYGGRSASAEALAFEPVAAARGAGGALRAAVSTSHGANEIDKLRQVGFEISGVERRGSSLKFGLLAAGEADIYPRFRETSAWDTAAGHAVLLAAGGCVTTLDGSALGYPHKRGSWLNPSFIAWADPAKVRPVSI